MRVGVDLAPLRPPLTGVGNYELYLLAALLSRADAPQIHGFAKCTWTMVDTHFIDEFRSAFQRENARKQLVMGRSIETTDSVQSKRARSVFLDAAARV